jgi:hypothetical protein
MPFSMLRKENEYMGVQDITNCRIWVLGRYSCKYFFPIRSCKMCPDLKQQQQPSLSVLT